MNPLPIAQMQARPHDFPQQQTEAQPWQTSYPQPLHHCVYDQAIALHNHFTKCNQYKQIAPEDKKINIMRKKIQDSLSSSNEYRLLTLSLLHYPQRFIRMIAK